MDQKVCRDCMTPKPLDCFSRRVASKDGKQGICKACSKAKTYVYRDSNPDVVKAISEAYYVRNRAARLEQRRLYVKSNGDKVKATNKRSTQKCRSRVNATNARHRAEKSTRTPSWADVDQIKAIYAKAARLSSWVGVKFHVDHIVPLRSKLVCGLHSHTNLQILEAIPNIQKGNRYWPDMWSDK